MAGAREFEDHIFSVLMEAIIRAEQNSVQLGLPDITGAASTNTNTTTMYEAATATED